MLLLYQTLHEETEDNCLPLGNGVRLPTSWSNIRRRTRGLIPPNETCFVWNGAHWQAVSAEEDMIDFDTGEPNVLRVRLLPSGGGGARLAVKSNKIVVKTSQAQAPRVTRSKDSALDETLHQVSDSLRSTLSLFAKTAESVAKAVENTSASLAQDIKRVEQIDDIRFRLGKKLAEGGFSEVFLAKEEGGSGSNLAIKRCLAQTPEQLDQLKREVQAHERLAGSEFILKLLASEVTRNAQSQQHVVRFVFPLCAGGSWFDAFAAKSDEENVRVIFLGAAKALQYMHERKMLHRDVKPHNILLTAQGLPLLMDLGSWCESPVEIQSKRRAGDVQEDAAQNCSAPYRAPELYDPVVGTRIGPEADVWSLGCTLFAVLWGRGYSPYEDAVQGVLKLAILNGSAVKFPPGAAAANAWRALAQHLVTASVQHRAEDRMLLRDMIRLVEGES